MNPEPLDAANLYADAMHAGPAPYPVDPYLDPDSGRAWCRVTWAWRATGETATAVGDYVNEDGGRVELLCGIYGAGATLDLLEVWFTDSLRLGVSAKVDRELEINPWAELRYPEGSLRVDLTAPTDVSRPP